MSLLNNGWIIDDAVTSLGASIAVDEIDRIMERVADFELDHECSITLNSITIGSRVLKVHKP
jgi:hypothetical protein